MTETFSVGDIIKDYKGRIGPCYSSTSTSYSLYYGSIYFSSTVWHHEATLVKKCADITADDPSWWKEAVPCSEPDPCEGVICEPECFDVDKHETICSGGICIKGVLIEADSVECGYVPPDPEPEPEPEPDETMDLIPILIIGIILYIIIKR